MPCEIATKKPNDKSEENSDEKKEETTKKPKSKSSRRRRSVKTPTFPCPGKRCIGELFGGFGRDSFLGASNPHADDSERYDSEVASPNVQSKKNEGDNKGEESLLQAIPTRKQLFGGKLTLEAPKRLNLFKNFSPASKNENLLHVKLPNSVETNEIVGKTADVVEADSSQSETSSTHAVEPFSTPQFSRYDATSYEPTDYLPSFEYFPKKPVPQQIYPPSPPEESQHSVVVGPSSFKSSPIYEHQSQQHDMPAPSFSHNQPQLPQNALPTHDKPFVIGPSSFKSSPLYDHLGSQQEIAHTTKRYTDNTNTPSGCRCDPEHFDDLLHHMQSSYKQFHNGMIQLFDTFRSQTNCGSKLPQISDSASSHSHPNFDYNVHCQDKNVVNADPDLTVLCQKAESVADPSSGYYKPPGAGEVKTGGFKNQFMSYADYIKMMQNVNYNSGTVLSQSHELDDDDVTAFHQRLPDDDSQENTMTQLRQHFDQYQSLLAAPQPEPEPVTEEPQVAAAPAPEDTEPGPIKSPLQFQIRSLLPEWKPRLKI